MLSFDSGLYQITHNTDFPCRRKQIKKTTHSWLNLSSQRVNWEQLVNIPAGLRHRISAMGRCRQDSKKSKAFLENWLIGTNLRSLNQNDEKQEGVVMRHSPTIGPPAQATRKWQNNLYGERIGESPSVKPPEFSKNLKVSRQWMELKWDQIVEQFMLQDGKQ